MLNNVFKITAAIYSKRLLCFKYMYDPEGAQQPPPQKKKKKKKKLIEYDF